MSKVPLEIIKYYTKSLRMKCLKLNGVKQFEMPTVGLGTWCATPEEIKLSIHAALDCGYRHIDTAFTYNNEESIGSAINEWIDADKGTREQLFITTKLPSFGSNAQDVEKYLKMSLNKLKLDYVDLYLIHMPFAFVCDEATFKPLVREDGNFALADNNNIETWKVMEDQVRAGLTKAIGLSNFNAKQIKNVYDNSDIKPSVLQIEMHAYLQQKELLQFCKENNIAVTAYSPLGSPAAAEHFISKYNYSIKDMPILLTHPLVNEIASRYRKTAAQILLKHLVQKDVVVIPKSVNPQRIQENINIFDFELSDDDMDSLNDLDKGENGRTFDFLFFKGAQLHPEYPFEFEK